MIDDIVDFSDFLPTLCEAARVKVPADLAIDVRSFLAQLLGKGCTPRDAIYMWYSRSGSLKAAQAFARNQRYKLYEDGRFFDVAKDRLEDLPLDKAALDADARAVKALLQSRIDALEDVTRPGRK